MPKDNRKIVQGVQFFKDGTLNTYADGQEDDLEAVMTPEQCERLKARGCLMGDWSPTGKEQPAPPKTPEEEARTLRKLQQENADLKRQLASQGQGQGHPTPALTPAPPAEPETHQHDLPEGVPAHPSPQKATAPKRPEPPKESKR